MEAEKIPVLETLCVICEGTGGYKDDAAEDEWAACYQCNGTGYIPTAVGVSILTLFKHQCRVAVTSKIFSPAVR